jgi:hypothetical protein
MSSYRRPDNPERTLWTEFDEKEDCGVTFSKFSIETCEEMITREEDCDRSAAEKSRRYRTERRVGAKKSSKEEEKGKDTLPVSTFERFEIYSHGERVPSRFET